MTLVDEVPPPSRGATAPAGLGEILADKYRVERVIGAGGMGVVLLATHLELERLVAIKLMREEGLKDADARARFAREAKAVVRLKSEHIARVLDVGTLDNGAPYLVMEYLEGCDLATVLSERGTEGLPIDEAVAYLLQVCEAVAEAHGAGIVHRDLKPRNVFVTTGADGKPLLKVLDFGISKLLPAEGATLDLALTKTTDIMGSPSYMAPEQMRAARDADERADIWSLGIMLYESITGHLPWEADSFTELGAMVLRDPVRPMRALRAGVPHELDDIVARCLEKDRTKRFASVVELAHMLEPHAKGLAAGSAERIGSVARTSKLPARGVSLRDRPSSSSSSRVAVSGGTSVSWGETELQPPKVSIPPRLQSRTGMAVAVVVVLALGATGYFVTARRAAPPAAASPPVLPEDRGAIRPPATSSVAPSAVPQPSARMEAAQPPATAAPLATIPRRAPIAPIAGRTDDGARPTVAPPPAVTSAVPAPKATDAHDMGSIPRK